MDNNQPAPLVEQPQVGERPINKVILGLCLFLLLTTAGLGFVLVQSSPKTTQPVTILEEVTDEAPTDVPNTGEHATISSEEWSIARFSDFNFKYPAGWHVAYIWPENEGPISIEINPGPVDTAPRDSNPTAIALQWTSYYDRELDTKMNEKIADFKNRNANAKEEIFETPMGTFHHLTAHFESEMYGLQELDEYHVIIKSHPNAARNHILLSGSRNSMSGNDHSSELREIMTSWVYNPASPRPFSTEK